VLRYLPAAYFFTRRYQDALGSLNRMTDRDEFPIYWLLKAAVHAELGQHDEAGAAVAEALRLNPEKTLRSEHERQLALGLDPSYAEHLIDALRKAGLPEGPTN
jgi:tetratricopeptide (TPR) repeat protein